jgi:predicted RNA-binding protein YlxR (DUF448 family)
VPRRRCVGCGRIAPKTELLRVALAREPADARVRAVLDHDGKLPGRGAYLCRRTDGGFAPLAEPACLQRATRRGGIARALRAAVTLAPELVESPEADRAAHGPASPSRLTLSES